MSDEITGRDGLPKSYLDYEAEELKKEVTQRWNPPADRRSAYDLYDTEQNKIAIVVGTGDSLERTKELLQFLPEDIVVIAVNRAITEVKADYWMFIDHDTYTNWKDHPNVAKSKTLGVDRFWPLYEKDVWIWRRSFNEDQVLKEGRLFHQNTSILPAIHFAFKLGCRLVVTVGCDLHIKPGKKFDDAFVQRYGGYDEYVKIMNFTFVRIWASLKHTLDKWKPEGCELVDASWGLMPVPKIDLSSVIRKVRDRANGSTIGAADLSGS